MIFKFFLINVILFFILFAFFAVFEENLSANQIFFIKKILFWLTYLTTSAVLYYNFKILPEQILELNNNIIRINKEIITIDNNISNLNLKSDSNAVLEAKLDTYNKGLERVDMQLSVVQLGLFSVVVILQFLLLKSLSK